MREKPLKQYKFLYERLKCTLHKFVAIWHLVLKKLTESRTVRYLFPIVCFIMLSVISQIEGILYAGIFIVTLAHNGTFKIMLLAVAPLETWRNSGGQDKSSWHIVAKISGSWHLSCLLWRNLRKRELLSVENHRQGRGWSERERERKRGCWPRWW